MKSCLLYVLVAFSVSVAFAQEKPAAPKKPAPEKQPAKKPAPKEPTEKPSLADIIERVEPSCVRIDVTFDRGRGIGSGFVVGDGTTVVTNYHVVAGAAGAAVAFSDGQIAVVKGYLVVDEKRDIAVITLDTPRKLKPLKLAAKLPRKGEPTIAIGAPKGLSFSASEGIVSAIRDGKELKEFGAEAEGTWLQTSTPISGGSSGGPLLNENGVVIGMNTAGIAQAQNLNFAISSLDIQSLLEKAKGAKVAALKEIKPTRSRRVTGDASEPEIACTLPVKRKFNHKFKIAEEEDKFDQVKWLRTEWIPISHKDPRFGSFTMRLSAPIKAGGPPPIVVIDFKTTSQHFQWIRNREMRLLIDGEAADAARVSHKGELGQGFVTELMSVAIRLDEFLKIALAETLEARLGATEFTLTANQLECLRDMASRFEEGKAPIGNITASRHTNDTDPSLPKNRTGKKKADAAKAKNAKNGEAKND